MSEEIEAREADDRNVYFVLAKPQGDHWELAKPGSENALPYAARQARALALGRLRTAPWALYELRLRPTTNCWCLVELTEDGSREHRLIELSAAQTAQIDLSIQASDRWSGPIVEGELLPKAWEGKLRIRHGKPVFVKSQPERESVARETQLPSTAPA